MEDPLALGDLFGPEDVLRIERDFPELFKSVFDSVDEGEGGGTEKPTKLLQNTATTRKGQILTKLKSGQTTRKPLPLPFERLSQTVKHGQCNRERCKANPEVKPSPRIIIPPHSRPNTNSNPTFAFHR